MLNDRSHDLSHVTEFTKIDELISTLYFLNLPNCSRGEVEYPLRFILLLFTLNITAFNVNVALHFILFFNLTPNFLKQKLR